MEIKASGKITIEAKAPDGGTISIELTIDDARALRNQLDSLLGETKYFGYQYYPYYPPVLPNTWKWHPGTNVFSGIGRVTVGDHDGHCCGSTLTYSKDQPEFSCTCHNGGSK